MNHEENGFIQDTNSDGQTVVRNPSLDELKEIAKRKTIEAVPVQHKEEPKKAETLKESQNPFEPKPVSFKLPSGKVAFKEGSIMVRRMTTVEEALFHDIIIKTVKEQTDFKTQDFLNTINKVLDNCIKSNISVYELSLIDKIPLFVFVVGLTYGFKQKMALTCKECGVEYENENIDLNKLNIKYIPDNLEYPKKISLKSFDFPVTIWIKYPLILEEFEFSTNTPSLPRQLKTLIYKAEGVLPSGEPITEENYSDIVDNLGSEDKDIIKTWIKEFSEYGSDVSVSKKLCKNSSCELNNKVQEIDIPFETLFAKIFQ